MSTEPVILVMGSGDQQFREYLLASIARRGPVWVFDAEDNPWTARYSVGRTSVDLFDHEAATAAARELAARRPIAGLVCYAEGVIVSAAHVARALGLPGPTLESVTAARNKAQARETLRSANLPQPRFALADSLDRAVELAAGVGFPLVCKPLGLGASFGVVRVDSADDLATGIAESQAASDFGMPNGPEVLLEEYLTGPEISIDSAVFDGEVHPFLVAHKQTGMAPRFEETGHTVLAEHPLLADPSMRKLLGELHQVLGWRTGMTHTELKLTAQGPKVIEVNGRSGGDLIPYLGLLATGVDPGDVAVDLALGKAPDVTAKRARTHAIRFLYPPHDGTVTSITMPEPGAVPGLRESLPLVAHGETLRLPPRGYVARYGALIVEGDDEESCARALDEAAALCSCEVGPLPPDPA